MSKMATTTADAPPAHSHTRLLPPLEAVRDFRGERDDVLLAGLLLLLNEVVTFFDELAREDRF